MNRGAAFYRNVVRLALPILLQNLCTTLLGLIDTFMVGALGEAPLAAVLVANIPVFVIQLVIFGLQSGSSVLISQFWGKGDAGSPALLHCDAVQAFLKVPFTPAELGVDLLTLSGHKIRAPKGIGVQYIRRGLNLKPLLTGGGQEGGLRPGTEPTAQAAALAAACAAWQEDYPARIQGIKEYALESLSAVPGLEIISRGDAPHICAVSLPGYPSEMLVRELSDRGVYVSSGSACHRGKPSHVFAALGLPKRTLMGVLRVSFSPESTRADVDALAGGLTEITKTRIAAR